MYKWKELKPKKREYKSNLGFEKLTTSLNGDMNGDKSENF